MDENQYREQMHEDEIDLRELILVLWKKKLTIICITLIAAILTGIFSIVAIKPVYHSRLNIIISMPESYHTKYGDYVLPITSNEQYINLITSSDIILRTIEDMGYDDTATIESIRDRITINIPDTKANVTQNSFSVKVSAGNPGEAKQLAQALFNNYLVFLDVLVAEGAVDYYINQYNVSLQSLAVSLTSAKEILEKNEVLLAITPQTINQGEALQEIQSSPNTSDFVVLENIINPNYTKIEKDIIDNRQSINSIENSMRVNNENLEELAAKKEKLAGYNESGDFSEMETNFVSVTKTNVYLPSEPIEPNRRTSPSHSKNVIIGAVLGGVVAVFVVLIKEYWFKPNKDNKNK